MRIVFLFTILFLFNYGFAVAQVDEQYGQLNLEPDTPEVYNGPDSLNEINLLDVDELFGVEDDEREVLIQPVHKKQNNTWKILLLLLPLAIIAFVQVQFSSYINDVFKGAYNANFAVQLYKDQEVAIPFSALLLNINFLLVQSFLLFLIISYFELGWWNAPLSGYLQVLGIVSGIYIVKYLLLKMLSLIFPYLHEINLYTFNFFLFCKVSGLIILPVILFASFADERYMYFLLWLGLAVVASLLIYNYLRGLLIAKNIWMKEKFHFMLYICSLEIAPMVLLAKVVSVLIS